MSCALITVAFTHSSLLSSSQAPDAERLPLPADGAAHHPGGGQLHADARLHDLQRLPVHRRGRRRGHGLLPVQLAEGGRGRHHGALPLARRRETGPPLPQPPRGVLLITIKRRRLTKAARPFRSTFCQWPSNLAHRKERH